MNLSDENPIKGPLIGLGATFAFVLLWLFVACTSGCANLPADPATRAAAVSNAVDTATLLLDAAWGRWLKHHPQDDPAAAEAAAADPFFAAKKHAICIVSADGRRRTNLLTD